GLRQCRCGVPASQHEGERRRVDPGPVAVSEAIGAFVRLLCTIEGGIAYLRIGAAKTEVLVGACEEPQRFLVDGAFPIEFREERVGPFRGAGTEQRESL